MTRPLVVTTPSPREISVERIFDASRERVWAAFTQAELVARWWGRGNPLTVETLVVERGGHWRFVEQTPEGGPQGFEGRFREVEAPEHLEYTFEWDGMPGHPSVSVQMLETLPDGKTKLVAHTLYFTEEERDAMLESGMEKGMRASYEALDRVLAG